MRNLLLLLPLYACNPTPEKSDDSSTPASDADKDGFSADEDCNDGDATIHPDALEACDGVDNNCDGTADEGLNETWWADQDGDGFGDPSQQVENCTAPEGYIGNDGDCAPQDGEIYPGAAEVCDGADNNCSGTADEGVTTVVYTDGDGDGFGDLAVDACAVGAGTSAEDGDCDDALAQVYPGASELCDGLDNDCDGMVDEDGVDGTTWYYDADGDGYGNCETGIVACAAPASYVPASTPEDCDCNDGIAEAHPSAVELCDGYVDEDCDGTVDEDDALDAGTWYQDADADGYGSATSSTLACEAPTGFVADATDCDDGAAGIHPGQSELCDGVDENCNGQADEGALDVGDWYADGDGDGYGDAGHSQSACTAPAGYVSDGSDCADGNSGIHPGAAESCDGVDEDCDGAVDDGVSFVSWYTDADGDGYGDPGTGQVDCAQPAGTVEDATDCNDGDAAISPAATEVCNGYDDDCDGLAEEADPDVVGASIWYVDSDGDGYGDAGQSLVACVQPAGYLADSSDCADGDALISPVGIEICNSYDDDCDGLVDDADPSIDGQSLYYQDLDGDGQGDPANSSYACGATGSYSSQDPRDCDDNTATTYEGAPELCNGVDDDCDGTADNGLLGLSSTCPAEDCAEIIAATPSAGDGSYVLTRGNYYCDMTKDGGGWTRVWDNAYVYGTGYDSTAYNSEGFSWDEVLFAYDSGSLHAHCTYPGSMTGCNNLGFQFDAENWGVPLNWGSSICGMATTDYTGATRYIGGYDFVVGRTLSTSTIRLGALEGISQCTTSDNPGGAYLDVFVRE